MDDPSKIPLQSLDDYIAESGFYISPCGVAGLANTNKKENKPANEIDIEMLDKQLETIQDNEICDILAELEEHTKKSLNVKKEVSSIKCQSSGFVRKNVQQRRNNYRVNPMAFPQQNNNQNSALLKLINRPRQSNYQNGLNGHNKNHQILGRHPNFGQIKHYQNGYNENQRFTNNNVKMDSIILNGCGIHPVAYENLIRHNPSGGIEEYVETVNSYSTAKYDMTVQKQIAEIQQKPMAIVSGNPSIVCFEGPGINSDIRPLNTNLTMNSRFGQM